MAKLTIQDTEFPGVVARPIADSFAHKASYHYQTIRCNVDLLKMIQLGITLFNAEGEVPPPNALEGHAVRGVPFSASQRVCPATWTFNFKFSLDEDMYASDSIELLKRAGHDFPKHAQLGIEFQEFGSLLITSGLTFNQDVHWISFHSGYDFGYLMKVMWCKMLPTDEDSYRRLMQKFFPNIYDVKFILRYSQKMRDKGTVTAQAANVLQSIGIKSSLQDLADEFGCVRHGTQHDAGSDAWLTGQLYFEISKRLFDGQTPEELKGNMWGLDGVGPPASAAAQAAALAQAMQNQAAAGNGILGGGLYHGLGHHRDGPSTPTTNPAGLASTPGQGFQSSMTPGAGVFGNYQYAK
jgi:CCR4-NOT transcription complex subunit 7/8